MSSTQQGSCNSGKNVRNKADKGEKAIRRSWSPKEEAVLLSAMKDLVANGWKSDNGFRGGYLQKLEDAIAQAFPGTDIKGTLNIQSKISTWKKNYGSLTAMLLRSGVGFNADGTHMIECTDDQWDQIKKCDSNARTMRFKPWPMFEEWKEIFGKDRATGENAEDYMDAVNNLMQMENNGEDQIPDGAYEPNVEDISVNDVGENSVYQSEDGEAVNKKQQKGKKRKNVDRNVLALAEIYGEMSRQTNARLETIASRVGYEFDQDKARKEAYGQLENIDGLSDEEKFKVCDILMDFPNRLSIFQGLPESKRGPYVQHLLKTKP